jgi:tetratricopeptide (TPR) repeat protein
MKINIYEEMYRRLQQLVRQKKDEYNSTLEYVKKKLLYCLIHYGTYLKTEYQKDDRLAAKCLAEALKYDSENPIAAYRLGFLAYKHKNYYKSIQYFQKAIENLKYYENNQYQLNSQQQVNAHLYLTNSALHIAKASYEKMNQLPAAKNSEIPNHEFSPLFRSLLENDQYLQSHAFYKISKAQKTTCSKEDCDELISSLPFETIILYFSDRNITAFFEGKEVSLTPDQGNTLSYLLIKTSEDRPATRHSFSVVAEIERNTYIQAVNRLRNRLRNAGFPPIIQTTRFQEETAYYFDGSHSFYVLYRVDEEIEYA